MNVLGIIHTSAGVANFPDLAVVLYSFQSSCKSYSTMAVAEPRSTERWFTGCLRLMSDIAHRGNGMDAAQMYK